MAIENLKIAVVGLGFVGLPVAAAFGKKYKVIGFDADSERIEKLKKGIDDTKEVGSRELMALKIEFTAEAKKLKEAGFIIITVPALMNVNGQQEFTLLLDACKTVGENMKKGAVVVFESMVYPGTTEDKCIPALEKYSKLKAGEEFFVGYSPERTNPGNKKFTFTKVKKVVSGQNEAVCNFVAEIYENVVEAGVFKAKSIRVAEAAKLVETTQQEVNIALMNDWAIFFNQLGIDTYDVLETAATKRNFIKYTPELVGGHSSSLALNTQKSKYQPQIFLSEMRFHDNIGRFIARNVIKKLIQNNIHVQGSRVTVLGLTYKEDVPDIRNSKVIDIIRELEEYGVDVQVSDINLDPAEVERQYGILLTPDWELLPASAVILAVPHKEYKEVGWKRFERLLIDNEGMVFDIKSILNRREKPEKVELWRI